MVSRISACDIVSNSLHQRMRHRLKTAARISVRDIVAKWSPRDQRRVATGLSDSCYRDIVANGPYQ
jgi:hypothetical protein